MIVEGPNAGAIISLNAIGQQDTYLTRADPDQSFFNYEMKQHSTFTKFHRNTKVDNPGTKATWPMGETVIVTMNPRNMGDLLSNMYIVIDFPGLTGTSNVADQIGRHIIESVSMHVDEIEVEKYHDDWGIIYDEMYLDASEKRTKRYTLNRNLAEGSSIQNDESVVRNSSKLMIPIPLFFSRKYEGDEYSTNIPNRPYFPICAMHKQKIEFKVKFRPQSFFTNSADTVTFDNFNIVTEEMTVSPVERSFLMTKKQVVTTDVVKRHPSVETEIGSSEVKLQLVPKIPVKTIFWFLRNKEFEDENEIKGSGTTIESNVFENRYNFSSTDTFTTANSFFNPVMSTGKFYVNGQDLPNILSPGHAYYKYVVPYLHRLSRPIRNIYTYTFSMNPINVEPSGSLDFGELKSDTTLVEIKLVPNLTKVYTLNIYYVGYQTFLFENGFMKLAY
jgi:hypothetical protein|tara:strand:- start:6202 stop:7536 length:1335 start_codon:yes stop_codon:yes gene_type:complete